VQGFDAYLPVVELHHENWDGSGYPHGLKAAETPRTARIVKVADSYDAMTSDRPYRQGMRHDQAVSVIEKYAGTQFDADAVRAFVTLGDIVKRPAAGDASTLDSLHQLAAAVRSGTSVVAPAAVEETAA